MDQSPHDARYAPPQVDVADIAPPEQGPQLAGRSRRFAAAFIDGMLQIAILWLVSKLTPYNPWGNADAGMWSLQLKSMLTGAAFFLVLNGYLLFTRGQTIGKILTGIRITRPSGEPASAGRLILRYGSGFAANIVVALSLVYALIDCLLIFRKSRRCLHDDIADTIVIKI